MSYIYDIVLNFNTELYEFFEWKKDDNLLQIKRINLILVECNEYNNITSNIVSFNNDFMLSIFNKCESYSSQKINPIPYAFILTDSYRSMALMLDNSGRVVKYSSLTLEDEEEILRLCHKLAKVNLSYQIINSISRNEFQTREEKNIVKSIKDSLLVDYKKNNLLKLKYLYYEYFNKQCDDINKIYNDLIRELSLEFKPEYYELYNLIQLTYTGKNV